MALNVFTIAMALCVFAIVFYISLTIPVGF